jgi:hypothetical protein
VPGLPRCDKRFVQSAMYADRRRVGAAHFAPGLGPRPVFAGYVLTVTDGQDMQKRNRPGPVAATSGDAHRRRPRHGSDPAKPGQARPPRRPIQTMPPAG